MFKFDMQKFEAENGKISFWSCFDEEEFDNDQINPYEGEIACSIEIPLKAFDSGLDYESQPTETSIIFENISLPVSQEDELLDQRFTYGKDECDGSIYIGSAHNPVDVNWLEFKPVDEDHIMFKGELYFDFEHEMVAVSETKEFSVILDVEG